ncbi:transposase, partial [Stenotrophomonas maltophilia WJ66]
FGAPGLENRSSRPHQTPHATPTPVIEQIKEHRRKRQTYLTISKALGVGHSTISRLMRAHGLNRLCRLEPPKEVIRYEYD